MPEFAPNPYLPDRGQQLAALLMSMGQGVTASDMAGRGVLPGLGMGASIFSASQAQAQQDAEKAWHWQQQQDMQKDYRKAQMGLAEERTAAMKRDAESKERMGGMLNGMLGFGVPPTQPTMGPGTFNTAIAGIETGGHADPYRAIGPETGKGRAYGKYQVMDFNVGPWTQEVLGRQMTPQEFLANDQAQEAVFNAKFGQYVKQYGNPQDAASVWFSGKPLAGNTSGPDVNGTTVAGYVNKFNRGLNPGSSQGAGEGVVPAQYSPTQTPAAPPAAPSQNAIQQLDPALRAAIAAVGQRDPEKAMQMLVTALQSQKKEDAWEPLTEQSAQMYLGKSHDPNKSYQRNRVSGKIEVLGERKKLDEYDLVSPEEAQRTMGPGYDPNKAYQRNKATGKLEVIGGSLVNINNQAESAFEKQISEQDAKRIGKIQENTTGVLETVNKVRQASEFLKETYTGPGADLANAWHRALGAVGVESARGKADAAAAAQAILAELTPKMRVEGSGATSDFEMKTFAAALPSLLNLPGGNEFVASLWEKVGNRAVAIQELAEKHAMQSKRLTGTTFTKEVKELGPLFSPEEMKRIKEAGKPAADRKPLDQILQPNGYATHPNPNAPTNMPNHPPLDSILGR